MHDCKIVQRRVAGACQDCRRKIPAGERAYVFCHTDGPPRQSKRHANRITTFAHGLMCLACGFEQLDDVFSAAEMRYEEVCDE